MWLIFLILFSIAPKDKANPYSLYQDAYFISGNPDTKIQFSFMYGLTDWDFNLFFAYTQTMFWDLKKHSKPFSDINFNPEVFYRLQFDDESILQYLDFGFYEHKSNGKDGDESRSFDRSYLRIKLLFPLYGEANLSFTNKFFYLYRLDENEDLKNYTGFYESRIEFEDLTKGNLSLSKLYLNFFAGGKNSELLNKGGKELGLAFKFAFKKLNPSLFFQIYNGYFENLLLYDHKRTSYRAGILF